VGFPLNRLEWSRDDRSSTSRFRWVQDNLPDSTAPAGSHPDRRDRGPWDYCRKNLRKDGRGGRPRQSNLRRTEMSDQIDFTPDDVLGFEFSNDLVTGERNALLTVMFKDGTEREFTGDAVAKVSQILQDYPPPNA
jgi:hypothetical protein